MIDRSAEISIDDPSTLHSVACILQFSAEIIAISPRFEVRGTQHPQSPTDGGAAMQQTVHACRFADQQCSLLKNRRTRWRSDQSIGLPSFIFTEGWFDVRDHEARGQSVLELCEWPSP